MSLDKDQAQVVQTLDTAIHQINHHPTDSVIDFRNTYPLDGDHFEQPGPENYNLGKKKGDRKTRS